MIFDVFLFIKTGSLSVTLLEAFTFDLQEHILGTKVKLNVSYSCSKNPNSPQDSEESSDWGRSWEVEGYIRVKFPSCISVRL